MTMFKKIIRQSERELTNIEYEEIKKVFEESYDWEEICEKIDFILLKNQNDYYVKNLINILNARRHIPTEVVKKYGNKIIFEEKNKDNQDKNFNILEISKKIENKELSIDQIFRIMEDVLENAENYSYEGYSHGEDYFEDDEKESSP
jgi:hypothetical protein